MSVEKKKELNLVDPNDTFKVSKRHAIRIASFLKKGRSDKEKAAIERKKQLNAPLQEHKKLNDKPTKADFDIHFDPSTHARKKKPPQEQPPTEELINEENWVPLCKGKIWLDPCTAMTNIAEKLKRPGKPHPLQQWLLLGGWQNMKSP